MRITSKQYAQTLYDLTDGKSKTEAEKSVVAFARYIYKERKLKLADKIAEQFGKIYDEKRGVVEAEVVTMEKVGAVLEKKLKNFVKEKYGAREVVLKNVADESVKGGFVLRVGDEVVDGSVRGRLEELRKIITE